jgi:lysophospholipase L1-like esterase
MKSPRFCLCAALVGCLAAVPPVGAQVIKVACVGDSITAGAGLATNDAYPAVLGRLLGTNYQTSNFGVGGTTVLRAGDYPYWNTTAFQNATNSAPNIVIIELGANDSKPQNWQYKSQFAGNLSDMIDVFAKLPSHPRVLVCQCTPAYGVAANINPVVIKNEVIPIIKQVAKDKGVMTVNLYTPMSRRPELFADLLHPNVAGAAILAKTLHGALLMPQ